jgi:hypothetical protein
MEEIIIEQIEPTFFLQQWSAIMNGKIYNIIFSKYPPEGQPILTDTYAVFIRDSEFNLSITASSMVLGLGIDDKKILFLSYINTFEKVKSKTPKP